MRPRPELNRPCQKLATKTFLANKIHTFNSCRMLKTRKLLKNRTPLGNSVYRFDRYSEGRLARTEMPGPRKTGGLGIPDAGVYYHRSWTNTPGSGPWPPANQRTA